MNFKGYKHLQYKDRLKIEGALRTGAKVADIALEIGVCKKTIGNTAQKECSGLRYMVKWRYGKTDESVWPDG